MSSEMSVVADDSSTVLIKYTETTISESIKKALDITLKGVEIQKDGTIIVRDSQALIDDSEGLAKVVDMRKKVVKTRTGMEAEQKKLKEDAWAECKRLDAERNMLLGIIVPVESRLKGLEKAVETELEAAVTRRLDAREKARRTQIECVGGIPELLAKTMAPNFIRVAEDPQFSDWLVSVQSMNEQNRIAEEARKAKEEADRLEAKRLADEKAERDRLQAIEDERVRVENKRIADELAQKQRELDQQAADQKAAQDKIDAENARLAKAEQDRVDAENARLAKIESDRVESERQAKLHEEKMKFEGPARTPEPSPYAGNVGSSWRFHPTTKTMSDHANIAAYAKDAGKLVAYRDAMMALPLEIPFEAPWNDTLKERFFHAKAEFARALDEFIQEANRRSQGEI